MALFKEKKQKYITRLSPNCSAFFFSRARAHRLGKGIYIYMYLKGKLSKQSLNRSSAVCHFFAYR